jgi:hypothetical protein
MLEGGVAPPFKLGSVGGRVTLVVQLVVIKLLCKPKLGTT